MQEQQRGTDAPETLTIRLFGTLEVHDDAGATAAFRRNKTGLLLASLALNPHRSHSRETLADLLWTDGDIDTVRNRLRQELSQLRRALRDKGIADDALLEAGQNTIRLCSGVTTDLLQYQHLLKQAERHAEPDGKRRLLLQAAALYRAPLLADFDESWILAEREAIALRHGDAMTELAALQQAQGNLNEAADTLRGLIAHDALNEKFHTELMGVYAAMGQPSQVWKQYQILEKALKEAFNESPSDAIQQRVHELRELAARNVAVSLPSVPLPPIEPTSPNLPLPETDASPNAASPQADALSRPSGLEELTSESAKPFSPSPRQPQKPSRPLWHHLTAVCAGLLVLAGGWFGWNYAHRPDPSKPVWVAEYHAQAGEKENSEATDVVADEAGNVYVCGFIQTDVEDVDILVLKYSPDGKLLWKNRYTSPEHDCDRAFSLIVDKGSVFVAGETYVPDTPMPKAAGIS